MNTFPKMKLKTLFRRIYLLLKMKIKAETKIKFKLPLYRFIKNSNKKRREENSIKTKLMIQVF
jgi:hypothetical protein